MNGFLIGRFQPFHLGHLEAVKFALSKVDHLHIGIGSSNKSNEKRNPFTADERKTMIESSLDGDLVNRITIHFIPDVDDHSKWTHLVDEIVPNYDAVFSNDDFTHELYQNRGKSIISVELKSRENLSGTNIRNLISTDQDWENFVPQGTRQILLKIDAKHRLQDL
tara:strand:- start:2991 stop:3485 length:495 start_codon:yes stop_codon:yes gene_type:complete